MVSIFAALLAAAAAQSLTSTDYPAEGAMRPARAAVLVWSDEFKRGDANPSKWRFDQSRNKEGWYNEERQYYSAGTRNAWIRNGKLIIEARKESLPALEDWAGKTIPPPGLRPRIVVLGATASSK